MPFALNPCYQEFSSSIRCLHPLTTEGLKQHEFCVRELWIGL
jgi:hypothetical protein